MGRGGFSTIGYPKNTLKIPPQNPIGILSRKENEKVKVKPRKKKEKGERGNVGEPEGCCWLVHCVAVGGQSSSVFLLPWEVVESGGNACVSFSLLWVFLFLKKSFLDGEVCLYARLVEEERPKARPGLRDSLCLWLWRMRVAAPLRAPCSRRRSFVVSRLDFRIRSLGSQVVVLSWVIIDIVGFGRVVEILHGGQQLVRLDANCEMPLSYQLSWSSEAFHDCSNALRVVIRSFSFPDIDWREDHLLVFLPEERSANVVEVRSDRVLIASLWSRGFCVTMAQMLLKEAADLGFMIAFRFYGRNPETGPRFYHPPRSDDGRDCAEASTASSSCSVRRHSPVRRHGLAGAASIILPSLSAPSFPIHLSSGSFPDLGQCPPIEIPVLGLLALNELYCWLLLSFGDLCYTDTCIGLLRYLSLERYAYSSLGNLGFADGADLCCFCFRWNSSFSGTA